jgi:hypothetical protein
MSFPVMEYKAGPDPERIEIDPNSATPACDLLEVVI